MQSFVPFIPERASTFADRVDGLYFYLVGLTTFFVLLISLTIIFFVIRYRRYPRYPFIHELRPSDWSYRSSHHHRLSIRNPSPYSGGHRGSLGRAVPSGEHSGTP